MRRYYGAIYSPEATRFRIWTAPERRVELILDGKPIALESIGSNLREAVVERVVPGTRYGYHIDSEGPFPDPASRWQPDGPHGLSAVVDSGGYAWEHSHFHPPVLRDLVIYELHTGSFTTEGTFRAAAARLACLRDLGINAVELMPLAECPGRWNWGYDGVGLYAPYHVYGPPDELRAFVDEAHRCGIAVLLDVVYNHLGPDGAYHGIFTHHYRSPRHQTPWGDGMNFDNNENANLRAFFLENALHWLEEYRVDGFRLDAVHAIIDDSPVHFLNEFSATVHRAKPGALVIAEDNRNEALLLRPRELGGFGLDAVWADDFHHQMRRHLAGDRHGYFAHYEGKVSDIVKTLRDGWFFQGQPSPATGKPRGTPPRGIGRERMVVCLQNHDQVGNRALGERLHHQITHSQWLAASALLLLGPETPLLFMGQEWAASAPFLYFTDHHAELGELVSEGRRKEFAAFPAFSNPDARARIPDPQAESTFLRSKLNWQERSESEHAECLAWYRELLAFRREHGGARIVELEGSRLIRLEWPEGYMLLVNLDPRPGDCDARKVMRVLLDSGRVEVAESGIHFAGAGALLAEVRTG